MQHRKFWCKSKDQAGKPMAEAVNTVLVGTNKNYGEQETNRGGRNEGMVTSI